MGSPPPTEMLSIVPSMVPAISASYHRSRRSDWRRHRKTTPRSPSYDGPRLRDRYTSLYLRELARRSMNGCPPVAMAPKVSSPATVFIQPDTEEEVVFLHSSSVTAVTPSLLPENV